MNFILKIDWTKSIFNVFIFRKKKSKLAFLKFWKCENENCFQQKKTRKQFFKLNVLLCSHFYFQHAQSSFKIFIFSKDHCKGSIKCLIFTNKLIIVVSYWAKWVSMSNALWDFGETLLLRPPTNSTFQCFGLWALL